MLAVPVAAVRPVHPSWEAAGGPGMDGPRIPVREVEAFIGRHTVAVRYLRTGAQESAHASAVSLAASNAHRL